MARPRMISVVGRKNAGKTTLVVALAQEYGRRGRRVATIKHGHHPAIVDREGKDTWRHFTEGRAAQTLIESPGQRVLFERAEQEATPFDLAARYLHEADVVIVEGFSRYAIPKIEVFRAAANPKPLFDVTRTDPGDWIAMVTDDATLRVPFPCFTFTDTSWFTNLAHLAWDRALLLDPA